MTVSELIKKLLAMPQNKRVYYIWDGAPRSSVEFVWDSERGVMVCDAQEDVYDFDARPRWAQKFDHWSSPQILKEESDL